MKQVQEVQNLQHRKVGGVRVFERPWSRLRISAEKHGQIRHPVRNARGMAHEHRQDLKARAFRLAVVVFELYPRLAAAGAGHAFVARQLLKASTSIGANLEEGAAPSSRRDMASKYSIALRESREANFWARLGATDPQWTTRLAPVVQETHEFVAMLTTSVKKLRKPPEENL